MRSSLVVIGAIVLVLFSGCGSGRSVEDQAKEGVQAYRGLEDVTLSSCHDIGQDRGMCVVTNHSNAKTATLHFYREVDVEGLSITPREVAKIG